VIPVKLNIIHDSKCCTAVYPNAKAAQPAQGFRRSNQGFANVKSFSTSSTSKRPTPSQASTQRTIQSSAIFLWSWCQKSSCYPTQIQLKPTKNLVLRLPMHHLLLRDISSPSVRCAQHGGISLGLLLSSGRTSTSNFRFEEGVNSNTESSCFYPFDSQAPCLFTSKPGNHSNKIILEEITARIHHCWRC